MFFLFKINFDVVFYSSLFFVGKILCALPKTNSGNLPGCAIFKGNNRLPTIHVQVLKVATVDGSEILPPVDEKVVEFFPFFYQV